MESFKLKLERSMVSADEFGDVMIVLPFITTDWMQNEFLALL